MKKSSKKVKLLLVVTLIFVIITSLMNNVLALIMKEIVDVSLEKDLTQFIHLSIVTLVYFVIFILISYLSKVFKYKFIEKFYWEFKSNVYKKLINKNLKEFFQRNTAEYISLINNDLSVIVNEYYLGIINIVGGVVQFFSAAILLLKLNLFISIIIFIIAFVTILIPSLLSKKLGSYRKNLQENISSFTTKIKEHFLGFELIKTSNIEKEMYSEFSNINSSVENSRLKFFLFNGFVETLSLTLSFTMHLTSIGLCAFLAIKGSVSLGTMIAVMQLMNSLVLPISDVSSRLNKIKSCKTIQKRIDDMCHTDTPLCKNISKSTFNQSIEFKELNFSYDDNKTLLKDISFNIEKGKKYAIIAKSGSGKSSIIKLLMRYYDTYEGNILIDNEDILDINTHDLYKLISLCHQNTFIFNDTFKNNITLFKEYEDHEFLKAIELVGLQNFIHSLPNKENEVIGENGCTLSGGEKQRISIARAILQRPQIIILDEATSSLDKLSAMQIEKNLLSFEDLTLIVITHRLTEETLRKYDEIICIDNNTIAEIGSFETLLSNDGYLNNIFKLSDSTTID